MIKKEFWEKVSGVWAKKDEIEIPDIVVGEEIPEDFFDDEEIGNLDDLLKDILESDDEEIDMTDFFS